MAYSGVEKPCHRTQLTTKIPYQNQSLTTVMLVIRTITTQIACKFNKIERGYANNY